jgi:cytosine/adenosine deaminase-related metal-dependent hydrolase
MTIFEADWICPVSAPPIRDGALAVEGEKILGVGRERPANAQRVSFPGCAIIPGFVNAHAHLELTVLRGFLEDMPFDSWIPRLTTAKYQQLTRHDMLQSARLGAIEMLRSGVTCVGEVMDLGVAWQAIREFGLRGIAYQEAFGPAQNQAEQAMTGLRKKIEEYRRDENDTVRVGVSPHAPYTVSAKLFGDINEYAQHEGLRLTTHIAESKEEGQFVRSGTGPFAENHRKRGIDVTPAGCSPLAYLDRLGLVRPEMLLIHAVDLNDSDMDILKRRRPAMVHCPKSNAKLAHGIARVTDIKKTDITIGLGTDSVSSNNVIDMFEEMRTAIFQQRARTQQWNALDASAAFRMATLDGAACLGLEKHLGSLEIGKCADFVVVDLNDPAVHPVYDPIQTMVYSASRHNVKATYMRGQEVRTDPSHIMKDLELIPKRLGVL